MALKLQFSIAQSDNGKTISFTETTGVYDANTDIGGWGTPNQATADALTAKLAISKRNNDGTYQVYNTIDIYGTLPNTTSVSFDITAENAGFGLDSVWPDSVYEFTYTVTGIASAVPFTAETTIYDDLTWGIECCFKKKAAAFAACPCNCDGLQKEMEVICVNRQLLCMAEDRGDLQLIQNYINIISKLCSNCGCG